MYVCSNVLISKNIRNKTEVIFKISTIPVKSYWLQIKFYRYFNRINVDITNSIPNKRFRATFDLILGRFIDIGIGLKSMKIKLKFLNRYKGELLKWGRYF